MAEEKRSIEISYKANLKDLISKLKTLPDVTSAEAKKMVSALDRQIKQAEKAAKKSAGSSTKAAKATAKAAKSGSKDFSKMADAAKKADQALGEVADQAGDADRGFMALGMALEKVNPALGEAARAGSDFAAVSEGMIMGFKSLNPFVIAAAAGVGLLALAYTASAEAAERVRTTAIDLRAEIKALKADQDALNSTLATAKGLLAGQILGYQELTGQITKYDAARLRAEQNVDKQYASQLQSVDQIIANAKEEITLINILKKDHRALSEEELKRLRAVQLRSDKTEKIHDLSKGDVNALGDLLDMEDYLNAKIEEQKKNRSGILRLKKESLEIADLTLEHEKEFAEETEKAAEAAERKAAAAIKAAAAAEREAAALNDALYVLTEEEIKHQQTLELRRKLFELTASESEIALNGIRERYDSELARVGELFLNTRELETFKQISQALYEDRAEEFHAEEMKRIQERNSAVMDGAKMLVSSVDKFAKASIDYLRNTDKATEESLQKLHKLQQAAAVANIAMTTAENIVKATGMGPAAPVLIAAAVAAGAAQTAAVLSSQPPTLHMGGMAPDERSTVLTGEAVLDRTTTRRLGEEGVRGLQNRTGGGGAEVIVLQPFKHFDRYNRSARRRGGRRAGSGGY